ncbi:MAG: cupin-like domain-containing protein [Sphingomonas bacterium]|nr:cupin-like domain-containing protein [Sphingomonas bacterium]
MTPVAEVYEADRATFAADIAGKDAPVVLRGAVADWPLVKAAQTSVATFAETLEREASDVAGEAWFAEPTVAGRFGFTADFASYNHDRRQATVAQLLALLLRQQGAARPYAMFAGALPVATHLPGFRTTHPMPLLEGEEMLVSLWLGNRTKTATHFDFPHNLACVVAGRRRFTLFPTEQARNLYIGPLDVTLAGQPSSMVDVAAPDLSRFPRYADAATAALTAELEPGDALYVPSLWWHAVESRDDVAAMVNYWWRDEGLGSSPFTALLHAAGAMATIPANERARWRALFNYFAFDPDSGKHLPERYRPRSLTDAIRARIIRSLGGKP